MSQIPPAALLHLREADVVRLCGLDAAARGLEAVARRAVLRPRRSGGRLEATVDGAQPCHVWVEAPEEGEGDPQSGCSCTPDTGATASGLGCEHIAALLAAWIRSPSTFATPGPSAPESARAAVPVPEAHTKSTFPTLHAGHVTQPTLLSTRPPRRAQGPPALAEELTRLAPNELADLGRRVLGGDTAGASQDDLRSLLAAHLADSRKLPSLLARLDPGVQALLHDVVLMGGVVTSADLDALAERSDRSADAVRSAAAALARHGLLFHVAGPSRSAEVPSTARQHVAGWRVPPEIRSAVAGSLALALQRLPSRDAHAPPLVPREDGAAPGDRPLRVVRGSPALLLLAVALLSDGPAPYNPLLPHASSPSPLAPANPAPRRAAHGASTLPLVSGDLAPSVLAELSRAADIPESYLRLARRVLLWARDSDQGTAVLGLADLPAVERLIALRQAFVLWRDAEAPTELADLAADNAPIRAHFDSSHDAMRPSALAAEVREARVEVCSLLTRLQPDVWYTIDSLLDLMWRVRPLFLRGRQQTYTTPAWWLQRPGERRPLRPQLRDEWFVADGEYIRALVCGPLHQLGVFDLALDESRPNSTPAPPAPRSAVALRLTTVGRSLLAGVQRSVSNDEDAISALSRLTPDWGAPLVPTREGNLAVQPLAAASSAGLRSILRGWARPRAIQGRRVVYALAQDLACEMFDRGVAPDVLLDALRAVDPVVGSRAASAVEPQLRAWRVAYGRSRITVGWTLLEARDEAALVEALAPVPDLLRRCHRLAPNIALIRPDDTPALQSALARRGYTV